MIESITFGAPSAASRSSLGGAAPENVSGGASSRRVPPSGFVPMYQAGAFERVPVPGLRCVRCGDSIRGVPIAGKPGPMHFGCFCDDASSASMSIRVSESTGGNALTSCHACGRFEEHRFEFKKCSRCNEVWYCSRGCQKTDWATHKHVCSSLAAASDSLSQVQSTAPQTPPAAQRPVQPPPLPQFRPRRRHPADSNFLLEAQPTAAAVYTEEQHGGAGRDAQPSRGAVLEEYNPMFVLTPS